MIETALAKNEAQSCGIASQNNTPFSGGICSGSEKSTDRTADAAKEIVRFGLQGFPTKVTLPRAARAGGSVFGRGG